MEIRDPVHGYVILNELERKVIDSPVFQRLRRIRQLAGAYLAYPGAQHTR
ncbi:MAG: HD domain-containing protein, partial [Thaumarchaeota archaeon]|nr:HD domain-containing protein [Nitrososphaerota archaeon]